MIGAKVKKRNDGKWPTDKCDRIERDCPVCTLFGQQGRRLGRGCRCWCRCWRRCSSRVGFRLPEAAGLRELSVARGGSGGRLAHCAIDFEIAVCTRATAAGDYVARQVKAPATLRRRFRNRSRFALDLGAWARGTKSGCRPC